MATSKQLPVLEAADDDDHPPKRLPPFVILKRLCAFGCILIALGGAVGVMLEKKPMTESETIGIWSFIGAAIAVAAWLWGGRDPD